MAKTEFFKVTDSVYCLRPRQTLSSNVYFLEHQNKLVLIDTGVCSLYPELKNAVGSRLVEKVLVTHGHFDHVEAAGFFEKAFLHKDDLNNLSELNSFMPSFQTPKVLPLDLKKIQFGPFSIQPIHVPGHTPGSTVYFEENSRVLFSGDSLFAGGVHGRTDLPLGNQTEYTKSVEKILALNYSLLCPGHGELE